MTNELLQCLECSRPRSQISTCKHKARWAGYQHIEEGKKKRREEKKAMVERVRMEVEHPTMPPRCMRNQASNRMAQGYRLPKPE